MQPKVFSQKAVEVLSAASMMHRSRVIESRRRLDALYHLASAKVDSDSLSDSLANTHMRWDGLPKFSQNQDKLRLTLNNHGLAC